MTNLYEQRFTGERALYSTSDIVATDCIFADGESPFKESKRISANHCSFQWKYPFWYCKDITVNDSCFFEGARAGIWYTDNISLTDCIYRAPKGFRRCNHLSLKNVDFMDASETLWNCKNVRLENVCAKGTYLAMNSEDLYIDNFRLEGDYSFDGCKNIEMHNAKMLSKDAFWNCENVTVYDSYICGEYFGWNSKNITLINCTIESLQGMCYMENIVMKDCKLLNTTLSFEYSSVDATITSSIDSVKNPYSGSIRAKEIKELIMEDSFVDSSKTIITTEQ